MCFSATASFVASGAIGAIGIATLAHVRQPRAVLFASLPMLFALHQFIEGFVWLGLDGDIGAVATSHVVFLYLLYAKGLLPLLIPLSVTLMEPAGWRRTATIALTVPGGLLCAWVVYAVVAFPSHAEVLQASIAYRNAMTGAPLVTATYLLATCGALLLSSHYVVRWFGILNVVGVIVVELTKGHAFASVWCFYAALLSIMLFWQFRLKHIDVLQPNRRIAEAG
jgi:hypothetical protein